MDASSGKTMTDHTRSEPKGGHTTGLARQAAC